MERATPTDVEHIHEIVEVVDLRLYCHALLYFSWFPCNAPLSDSLEAVGKPVALEAGREAASAPGGLWLDRFAVTAGRTTKTWSIGERAGVLAGPFGRGHNGDQR